MSRDLQYWQDLACANRSVAEAAQAQRDELTNVLRAAGWATGEIDSAAETIHKAEAQRDKAVADADHFFVLSGQYLARANDAEAQRDKALVFLQSYRSFTPLGHQPHMLAHEVDLLLKECGK
jgi:hypothetical protein